METIKTRDIFKLDKQPDYYNYKYKFYNCSMKNASKYEKLLKSVFICYYGLCIENINYFHINNYKEIIKNSKSFESNGIISEETISILLKSLLFEDSIDCDCYDCTGERYASPVISKMTFDNSFAEEVKFCLSVLKHSDYFIKINNDGYILNGDKFERERKILREIFVYNGYLDGVSFKIIEEQLKSIDSITEGECLVCLYIVKFGKFLNKKDAKYYFDLSLLTENELELMNTFYKQKNRNNSLNLLYSWKDKITGIVDKNIMIGEKKVKLINK